MAAAFFVVTAAAFFAEERLGALFFRAAFFVPVDRGGYAGLPGDPGVRMEPFIAGTEPRGASASSALTP